MVEQHRVQFVPHTGLGPLLQTVPQGHATTTHLAGEVFPGNAGLEYEQDAAQANPVFHSGAAALGIRVMFRKYRLDQLPELIRDQWLGHRFLREQSHQVTINIRTTELGLFRSSKRFAYTHEHLFRGGSPDSNFSLTADLLGKLDSAADPI
jgi:hypothetical protein